MKKLGMSFAAASFLMLSAADLAFGGNSLPTGTARAAWSVSHPVRTPFGIVFTNEMGNGLYLIDNGKTETLFTGPGCGTYFTLSPDRSVIGFKEIFSDGTQAPALLDIRAGTVTLLHEPVSQCGQVSFSSDSSLAYSIGDDIFIGTGTIDSGKAHNLRVVKEIPLGMYSNIVALSSDGSMIAYSDGHGYIHEMNLRTGKNRMISGQGCMMPVWAPVGERLCYSSLNGELFVFDARSEKTYALGSGTAPAWTADGSSLVVVRTVVRHDSLVNSDLYEVPFDGQAARRLTTTGGVFETDPSVGPGGTVTFSAYNSSTVYTATLNQETLKMKSSVEINPGKLSPSKTESEPPPPGSPSATPDFEVPYINQVYDTPPSSLGDAACAPTSAMMVLAYYHILPPWNLTLTIPTRHVSPYGNYILKTYFFHGKYFSGGGYGYMWNTSDPYHMMASYYDYSGLSASRLDSPSLDTVISEVDAGYPYTLCNLLTSVGHVIVINGVGSKYGTVVANDPYGDKNIGQWPNYSGKDVQYDWPGYNNGYQNLNQAAWGVSVRYTPPARQDSIVDDLQFNDGFLLNNAPPASMSFWQDVNTGYDGHFWYTHTRSQDTCTAMWIQPDSLPDGRYEVSAYTPSFSSRALGAGAATAVRYRIFHSSDTLNGPLQEDSVMIDQSKYPNSWISLGTYPFAKGDSGYVKLGDGSKSTGQIVEFDAMKWHYQAPLLVQGSRKIPAQFELGQNYPNPFNPTTTIKFEVQRSGFVVLKVYDILGRLVKTLVDSRMTPGEHSVVFQGLGLASGLYFYRLEAGSYTATKKMMLVK